MSANANVVERRLRPIYNALDANNFKKALQEADKALKKQPNLLCAKVLRALALYRLDRAAECESIVDRVCELVPVDDATLQALTICYKELQQAPKICRLYEAVVQKLGVNGGGGGGGGGELEEFHSHLFMSYVRVAQYKNQHRAAMTLYRSFPKNPYYFWAVMSLLMQSIVAVECSGAEDELNASLCDRTDREDDYDSDETTVQDDSGVVERLAACTLTGSSSFAPQPSPPPLGDRRQSDAAATATTGQLNLTLAARMCDKFAREQRIESEAEVQLYLMVLEQQGKYSAALNVLSGQLAQFVRSPYLADSKRLEYLQRLGDWQQLCQVCRQLIEKDPSQWSVYDTYLRALFVTTDSSGHTALNSTSSIDGSMSATDLSAVDQSAAGNGDVIRQTTNGDVGGFSGDQSEADAGDVTSRVTNDSAGGNNSSVLELHAGAVRFLSDQFRRVGDRERAPLLAIIRSYVHLHRRIPLMQIDNGAADFCDQLREYVHRYGHRSCCFGDICDALCLVPANARVTLMAHCRQCVNFDAQQIPATLTDMSRHLTWLQVRLQYDMAGADDDDGCNCMLRVQELLLCYHAIGKQHLYDQKLTNTDIRPNDMYMVLACQYLQYEWLRCSRSNICDGGGGGGMEVVVYALTLLHAALLESPANFTLKLLAIRFYCLLGGAVPALAVYERLELKSVQLDSLSHEIISPLMSLALWQQAKTLLPAALRFFESSTRDVCESLIAAYKVGSFRQAVEFVRLQRRLSCSLNYRRAAVDSLLLGIVVDAQNHAHTGQLVASTDLQAAGIDGAAECHWWLSLCDNRDLSVLPVFSAQQRTATQQEQRRSFRQNCRVFRIRHALARAVVVAASVKSQPTNCQQRAEAEESPLAKVAAELGRLAARVRRRLPTYGVKRHDTCVTGFQDQPWLSETGVVCGQLLAAVMQHVASMLLAVNCDASASAVELCCDKLAMTAVVDETASCGGGNASSAGAAVRVIEMTALMCEALCVAVVVCVAGSVALTSSDSSAGGRAARRKRRTTSASGEAVAAAGVPDAACRQQRRVSTALAAAVERLVNEHLPSVERLLTLERLKAAASGGGGGSERCDGGVSCDQVLARLADSYRQSCQQMHAALTSKRQYLRDTEI